MLKRFGLAALLGLGVLGLDACPGPASPPPGNTDSGSDAGPDAGPPAQAGPLLAVVTVSIDGGYRDVPADFLGLSLEYGSGIPLYMGTSFSDGGRIANVAFENLMANLRSGTLRIGGNSTDQFCWADGGSNCGGLIAASTLRAIHDTSLETGWPVMLGANLAMNNASVAHSYVRSGLVPLFANGGTWSPLFLGVEIGNEPDLYARNKVRDGGYTPSQHVVEFNSYVNALKIDGTTAGAPIVGPAYSGAWSASLPRFMNGVVDGGIGAPRLSTVTHHLYPTNVCSPDDGGTFYGTAANLLSAATAAKERSQVQWLVAMASDAGFELQLGETNSAACGGAPGVSNAAASALWALDYLFIASEQGAARLNFHGGPNPQGYTPIVGYRDSTGALGAHAQPLYYAMLLFSDVAPGSRLLPVQVSAVDAGTKPANIAAHAVRGCGFQSCFVSVFVVNKDLEQSGTVAVLPTGGAQIVGWQLMLSGAALDAGTVTINGASIDETSGALPYVSYQPVQPQADGTYVVDVPVASAVRLDFAN